MLVFDISWTGAGGYTMEGTFTFNNALLNTGAIDESDIDTLTIEGFLSNVSVGNWDYVGDGLTIPDGLNFNFDTATLEFLVGGLTSSSTGQIWATAGGGATCSTTGFGFASGSASQLLCVAGAGNNASSIPVGSSTLVATRTDAPSSVPEPSTLLLLGGSLAAFVIRKRRK